MSKERVTEKSPSPHREKIRVRVDKLRQSRQRSMIGVAELVGLAGSAVMVLAVIFAYLSIYGPAQSRLNKAEIDRRMLQQKLKETQQNLDTRGSLRESVSRIGESLDKFENERLMGRDTGRLTLYNTLIQLIRSNNLRNTSGPAYIYLEAKGTGQNQSPRLGNAKWQSLYPGISVTVTVEGQYANLRRFVRDIESSSQFIIINAVELERASDEGPLGVSAPSATTPGATKAGPRANLVSLKVDMAAYYQREGGGEAAVAQPANQTR